MTSSAPSWLHAGTRRLRRERDRAALFGGAPLMRRLAADYLRVWAFPARPPHPCLIQVEPTRSCNLRCTMCLRDRSRPVGPQMSLSFFREIVTRHFPDRHFLLLYGQGEPLLCRDFFDLVRWAKERGHTVVSVTNGTLLSEAVCAEIARSGLDLLRVSIDGASERSYAAVRRDGSFGLVCTGVEVLRRRLEQARGHTRLALTFMALKENYEDIPAMVRLTSSLGLRVLELKSLPPYDDSEPESLTVAMEDDPGLRAEVARLLQAARAEAAKRRVRLITASFAEAWRRPRCLNPWFKVFVAADGQFFPCSRLCLRPEASLGSLPQSDFGTVWTGPRYTEIRRLVRAGCPPFPWCRPRPVAPLRARAPVRQRTTRTLVVPLSPPDSSLTK